MTDTLLTSLKVFQVSSKYILDKILLVDKWMDKPDSLVQLIIVRVKRDKNLCLFVRLHTLLIRAFLFLKPNKKVCLGIESKRIGGRDVFS